MEYARHLQMRSLFGAIAALMRERKIAWIIFTADIQWHYVIDVN